MQITPAMFLYNAIYDTEANLASEYQQEPERSDIMQKQLDEGNLQAGISIATIFLLTCSLTTLILPFRRNLVFNSFLATATACVVGAIAICLERASVSDSLQYAVWYSCIKNVGEYATESACEQYIQHLPADANFFKYVPKDFIDQAFSGPWFSMSDNLAVLSMLATALTIISPIIALCCIGLSFCAKARETNFPGSLAASLFRKELRPLKAPSLQERALADTALSTSSDASDFEGQSLG